VFNPMESGTGMSSLHDNLKKHFGFEAFLPGQEAAIAGLLDGKSVLAIFPTGGGKSMCYQLPALLLDGLTLVISPLIALMKDQLDFLIRHGAPAARLDSTLTREENLKLFDDLNSGTLKLLYISPERLGNERFLRNPSRGSGFRCSPSTRPTASRNGAIISAPTI
jgi:ATP-dependent DNA helicase RecQ